VDKVRVYLVASLQLRDKSAAAITLARHLSDTQRYEVLRLPSESHELAEPPWLQRLLERLKKTRFARWVRDFRYLATAFLPLHLLLPTPARDRCAAVVLTVACGNGWLTAAKYARRHNLPLAVRFDDWRPDCVDLRRPLRALCARHFGRLIEAADLSLCISEGMQRELGSPKSSVVVLPIPAAGRARHPWQAPGNPFRVCYLGNMYEYGPMLGALAEAALGVPDIRLEFRGSEPSWPVSLQERMKASGQLHGFLDGEGFRRWYESFDCYLVAMFFDECQRRRVKTCFATKLLDYSAMSRPIVIWAPEESAVVAWARRTGAALCVTDPGASAVLAALGALAQDPAKCRALGDSARAAYESEFNPDWLQRVFDEALSGVAR